MERGVLLTESKILELKRLLGLDLTPEASVELLREIEERKPDRVGVARLELERLLGGQRPSDEAAAFHERECDRVFHQVKLHDSLRPLAKRLGGFIRHGSILSRLTSRFKRGPSS